MAVPPPPGVTDTSLKRTPRAGLYSFKLTLYKMDISYKLVSYKVSVIKGVDRTTSLLDTLSMTLRPMANANLYHVTKFPLY